MDTIYKNINNLYDKAGYLDRYGTDLYITIVVIILFFIGISYYQVMSRVQPIRADWIKQRCNPSVIPFAGLIYKPEGKTTLEATGDNFTQCSQTVLQNISGYALQPFTYLVSMINEVFLEMANSVNSARAKINNVRDTVENVGEDVMGRSLNIMSPIQQMLVASKSAFGKASGVGATTIYTLYGAFLALKALIGSIVQFIIVILVGLAAAIIILWILPFTWPIAAAGTAVFVVFAAFLSYLMIAYSRAMHGRTNRSIPSKPGCFDGETELMFDDGTFKKMKDISISDFGRTLHCGSQLTGMVDFLAKGSEFYNINGLIVTGSHRIIYQDTSNPQKLVHKEIKNLGFPRIDYNTETNPIVYCPITNTGHFKMKDFIFADWIDLEDAQIASVADFLGCERHRQAIYKRVNAGFSSNTVVKEFTNKEWTIDKYPLGVALESNSKQPTCIPIAKVRMLPQNKWCEMSLRNGKHLVKNGFIDWISDDDYHVIYHTLEQEEKIKPMVHLVTTSDFFWLGNILVADFNEPIDEAIRRSNIKHSNS